MNSYFVRLQYQNQEQVPSLEQFDYRTVGSGLNVNSVNSVQDRKPSIATIAKNKLMIESM